MFRLSTIALVVCTGTVIAMPTAQAADIPEPIPTRVVIQGWYLRGDIGYSNQRVDSLDNALYADFDSVDNVYKDFDGAPFFAAGVGYRWNNWFRTDVTGEYRSKSDFDGLDIGDIAGILIPDNYLAKKSEWLALLKGYLDVGTWHGITPSSAPVSARPTSRSAISRISERQSIASLSVPIMTNGTSPGRSMAVSPLR